MKTIDEKREAVLAFCERVFAGTVPGQSVEIMPSVAIQAGYISDLFEQDDTEYECIYLNIRGRMVAELWSKSNEWEIDMFYKLMGLETADAVAEAIEKLAEGLQKAKSWEMFDHYARAMAVGHNGLTEQIETTMSFDNYKASIDGILNELEAHKKGVVGE